MGASAALVMEDEEKATKRLVWEVVQSTLPGLPEDRQKIVARTVFAAFEAWKGDPSPNHLVSILQWFGLAAFPEIKVLEGSEPPLPASLMPSKGVVVKALALAVSRTLPWPPAIPPRNLSPEDFTRQVREQIAFWKSNATTIAGFAVEDLQNQAGVEMTPRQVIDLRREAERLITALCRKFPKGWKLDEDGIHPAFNKLARVLRTTGPAGREKGEDFLEMCKAQDGLIPQHAALEFLRGGLDNIHPGAARALVEVAWVDGWQNFPAEIISHAVDTVEQLALHGPIAEDERVKLDSGGVATVSSELIHLPIDLDRIGAEFLLPCVFSIADRVQQQSVKKIRNPHIIVDPSFAESAYRVLGREPTDAEYRSVVRAFKFGAVVQVRGHGFRYPGFYAIAKGEASSAVKFIAYDVLDRYNQKPARSGKPAAALGKRQRSNTGLVPIFRPYAMREYDPHFGSRSKARQQVARIRFLRAMTADAAGLASRGEMFLDPEVAERIMCDTELWGEADRVLRHLQDHGDILMEPVTTGGWMLRPADPRILNWAYNEVNYRSLHPNARKRKKAKEKEEERKAQQDREVFGAE